MAYLIIITEVFRDISSMKKSPTLPSIKDKQQSTRPGPHSKETFRKIEHRVNFHDEELVKNEKIISTLANQFRLLKQQLEFQQQYAEQYKVSIDKYEEESSRQQRNIKDQKIMIIKLQQNLKEKQKYIETLLRDSKLSQKKAQDLESSIEQLKKTMKKKEDDLRAWDGQKERLLGKLKQKQKQNIQLQKGLDTKKTEKEHLIEKLSKDVDTLNGQLEKKKEQLLFKENQLRKLADQAAKFHQSIRLMEKKELQLQALITQNEQLRIANEKIASIHTKYEANISELSSNNKNLQEKIDALAKQLKLLHKQKQSDKQFLNKTLSNYESLKKSIENETTIREQLVKECQESKLKLINLEKRFTQILNLKTKIGENLRSIQKSTICELCRKGMKNPVTNIPCGHSFCLECKKGYEKQCIKCPGVKREAVYRNQLLDDIVQAANLIGHILKQLQSS